MGWKRVVPGKENPELMSRDFLESLEIQRDIYKGVPDRDLIIGLMVLVHNLMDCVEDLAEKISDQEKEYQIFVRRIKG